MEHPTIDDVREAARRIAPYIHRTPVLRSRTLERELGAELFFKCENLQKVGAFKARGALNAVLRLGEEQARRGVITHSSGNHGAALAYAASMRGVPCTVVIPEGAPAIKVEAVRGYGAEIVLCPRSARETTCARLIEQTGRTLIHPFEHPDVVAGQGSAALELLEEQPQLDLIVTPVGGGGLLAGSTIAACGSTSAARLWGAEPEAADDAYRSLQSGVRQPGVPDPRTICDGLLTGLGELAFEIVGRAPVEIVTVSESAVIDAALFILQRMKIVVEPSAATVLAALRRRSAELANKRVGVILSGGNTDLAWIPRAG